MKVVILSGGIGYRLKEETEFKPKPMVFIGNKPILWHIMKIYSHFGFNEFIIALGYKGDYIKDYFINQKYFSNNFTLNTRSGHIELLESKDSNREEFQITFVDTGEDTLPGERILRIKDFIPERDKDFMVTYGDGVSNVDINALLEFHKKKGSIGTITGVHPRSKYGFLAADKNKIVKLFIEKPMQTEWINGGFMVFKKEFFKYIHKGEYEHSALERLINKGELSIYTHDGFWHSMDTYHDVTILNRLWLEGAEWKVWK